MKKIIFSILIITLLAAGGYGGYYYFTKSRQVALAQFFPADTYLYFHAENSQEFMAKFNQSAFGRALKNIHWESLSGNAAPEIQEARQEFKEWLASPEAKVVFEKFFGHEFAAGLYPSAYAPRLVDLLKASEAFNEERLSLLGSTVILATKVGADVEAGVFIRDVFNLGSADVILSETQYQDFTITVIASPKLPFKPAYFLHKGVLVMSLAEGGARKSIDTLIAGQSLKDNEVYKGVIGDGYSGAAFNFFVNLKSSLQSLQEQIKEAVDYSLTQPSKASEAQKAQGNLEDLIQKLSGLDAILMSLIWDEALRAQTVLRYNPAAIDSTLAAFYTCHSKTNSSLGFLPEGVLFGFWNGCFDGQAFLQEIEAAGQANTQQINMLDKMREYFNAIDHEFGGFVTDISPNENFPLPKLVFFVKVKDKGQAEALINGIDGLQIMPKAQENYKNINLVYIRSPLGESVEPTYGFIDKFLFITVNRVLLKEIIDAKETGALLMKSISSQKSVAKLNEPVTVWGYVDTDVFVGKVAPLINWADSWADKAQGQQRAFLTGSEQKLDEIETQIKLKQAEIEAAREKITALEDEIWSFESQGLSTTETLARKTSLLERNEVLEKELPELEKQRSEIAESLITLRQKALMAESRDRFKEDIALPWFDAWGKTDQVFMRSTNEPGIFASELILTFP